MLSLTRKLLCILMIGTMVLSPFVGFGMTTGDSQYLNDIPTPQVLDEGAQCAVPEPTTVDDISLPDISTGTKGTMKVYVATEDVPELAHYLADYSYGGALGSSTNGMGGISFLLLDLPIEAISGIAELNGVLGVYEYTRSQYSSQIADMQQILGNDKISPSAASVDSFTKPDAWTGGYSGQGVNVAVCDSGVDFSHPDLQNAYARDEMIFDVTGETIVKNTGSDLTEIMVGSSVVEILDEPVVSKATGGEQKFQLKFRNILPDSEQIFVNGNLSIAANYSLNTDTGFLTLVTPLSADDELSASYNYYFVYRNMIPSSLKIYENDTIVSTDDYSFDAGSGTVTFTSAIPENKIINVSYQYYSPYYGWPIAFDPVSMDKYLGSEGNPDNTYYINTSLSGPGPFESSHTIAIDGMSDFVESEGFTGVKISDEAFVQNFDLQKLYATRDPNFWYFGFSTAQGITDKTYTIYMDTDGSASGAAFDPLGNLVDTNSSHSTGLNVLAYNPSGTQVASAAGNIINIWDNTTGDLLTTIKSSGTYVGSLAWTQNGTWLCSANGKTITVWDLSDINNVNIVNEIQYVPTGSSIIEENQVLSINENATGTWLALAGVSTGDKTLYIYNILNKTNSFWAEYTSIFKHINSLAYSPNGTMIAIAFESNTNTTNLKVITPINNTAALDTALLVGHNSPVKSVAWSPDSTKLISGDASGIVKVWDVATQTCLNTFSTGSDQVNTVAWGAGGKMAAAGANRAISIWDAGTYALDANLTGQTGEINTIDLSTSGDLVSGSSDTKVTTWTPSGSYIRTFLTNLPDYALVVNYTRERSDDWQIDEDGIVLSHNDTMANATLYTWNGADWIPTDINEAGGDQAYRSFADATNEKIGIGFVDIAVPRNLFAGDPDIIESELFVTAKYGHVDTEWLINATGGETSATLAHGNVYPNQEYASHTSYKLHNDATSTNLVEGTDYTIDLGSGQIAFLNPLAAGDIITASYYYYKAASHAQDSVPTDVNVPYPENDWDDYTTSLSNLGRREIKYYTIDLPASEVSKSNIYKFGFHPGEAQIVKFGALGVLVVDNRTEGVYERVYVDLNNDKVFDDQDSVVYKGNEITQIDNKISGVGPGSDGIADYSAGMLYYIADGMTPIPYSEVFSERHGLLERHSMENWTDWRNTYLPKSGDIVCLEGEFGYDSDNFKPITHGTMSAAVIAGRGNTSIPQGITGAAPNASIIPISNINKDSNIFDAWYFAVEGYDGIPGTGDEAVIVNNGFNYPSLYEDGWDPYSRYADYISNEYADGKTLFVTGSGDEGFGYGTLSSPGACPGVLSVGSATDYYYKSNDAITNREGAYPHAEDVAFYSSRGPSALGVPKPDLLAVGTGITDKALDGDGGSANMWYNEPWIGSDYACSATVGALSLVYEAYYGTSHSVTGEVVEHTVDNVNTLMLKHSPVLTCSLTNNGTAIPTSDYTLDLATGTITFNSKIASSQFINATYVFNNEFPDVATARNIIMSGASDTMNDILAQGAGILNTERSIKLAENTDGLKITPPSWVPGQYNGVEHDAFVNVMHPGDTATEDFSITNSGASSENVNIYDALFQKTGEYSQEFPLTVTQSTSPNDFINKVDILNKIPASTQLLKITAHAEYDNLDGDGDGVIDPDSGQDFIYKLSVIDWNDVDGNGEFGNNDYGEGNTFDVCDLPSNVLQVRVNSPVQRSHDGLFVIVGPKDDMPSLGSGETKTIVWTVTCEFYSKTDWSWMSTDQTGLTIPGSGTDDFTATLDIPADAGIGSYDGAIYVQNDATQIIGENVVEYPTFDASEELLNVSMMNVNDEIVANSTPTSAQLANFPVTGSPLFRIEGSSSVPIINETSYITTPGDAGNEVTFYTANAPLLDINLYVFIPGDATYPLGEGSDYVVNMTTGNITTIFGGVDQDWEFYTYYNYSALSLTHLSEGVDYSLNYSTGAITLNNPLTPGDTLYGNYTWYTSPPATVTVTNFPVHIITLYVNGSTAFTDYTIDLASGVITFTQPPGPGDVISANYTWYVPEVIDGGILANGNIVPGTCTLYNNGVPMTNYTLDPVFGTLAFNDALIPGSNITADYTYYAHTVTIPVFINIAADKADFTFGASTTFSVTGDILTNVPTNQVVNENVVYSYPIVNEFLANVPVNTVSYEFVVGNPLLVVTGEHLDVTGGESSTFLSRGSAPSEAIDDCTLYDDSVPMTQGVDYTFNSGGLITFMGAYDPLPSGHTITADYTYYNPKIHYGYLDIETTESIVPGSYTVYNNGITLSEGTDYTINLNSGILTFQGIIYNLPLDANITCDYQYYEKINTVQLSHGAAADEAILPGSYKIFNNSVEMVDDTDYTINLNTGLITFKDTYKPLSLGSVITANYSYYNPIETAALSHGSLITENIVAGSYVLTLNNGTGLAELSEPSDYTLNVLTGIISFTNPMEFGDIITANYSYYNTTNYVRTYSSGSDVPYGFSYIQLSYRNIVNGTCIVYKNGVQLNEGVDYDIDLASGIVSFTSPISPTDNITADYSYSDTSAYPFNTNGMIGGYGAEGQSGDWRFFYVDIPDQGINKNPDELIKLYIDTGWNDKPSDIDVFVFSNTLQTTDPATEEAMPEDRYGPYTLTNGGGSQEDSVFYTSTNSSREIVTAPFSGGLNMVVLHNVILNGTAPYEEITGDVGWVRLSTDNLEQRTNELAGDTSFTLLSNKEFPEGMNASAVGPASGETTQEMVSQDNLDIIDNLGFYQGLTDGAGFHKAIKVESALTLDVHCWPDDPSKIPDVDLGICYDANEDGIGQFDELITKDISDFVSHNAYGYQPFYASCADWDADEAVTLLNPPDGQYVITILGYDVKQSPQPINLEIKAIRAGVEGFGMTGNTGEDLNPMSGTYESGDSLDPFTIHTYTMSWNFPGSSADGEYGGVVNLGPSNAPGIISILANVILDTESPDIKNPLPAENSIINQNVPTINIMIEDLGREEIDASATSLKVDGMDITPLASINVPLDEESAKSGYPRGMVIYEPYAPLSDGGHIVELTAKDWTGNAATFSWAFTVDTTDPLLSVNLPEITYTNSASIDISGNSEAGSEVMISGVNARVNQNNDGFFTAAVLLSEGENQMSFMVTDMAENSHILTRTVFLDTEAPEFDRVIALDGTTTNQRITGIYGEMTETGILLIDGQSVPVNSDGTFRDENINLVEGTNTITMEFTDMAGNVANNTMDIILDTSAPTLVLDGIESVVNEPFLNLSGTTDADIASLTVNGKLVPVSGDGSFQNSLRLSPGSNTIVIESKDRAGNSVQEIKTVTFTELDNGTNWSAIAVMIVLAVVALILGLMFGRMMPPAEEEIPEDADMEEIPEEETLDQELPEDMDAEEMESEEFSEDAEPIPEDEDIPDELPEDAEPIPEEEGAPEELPEGAEPIPAEEGIPEEISAEPEEEMIDISDEITAEEPVAEDIEDSPESIAEAPVEEDPRITKLKEAYESGKISKELYEKNLARFQKQ